MGPAAAETSSRLPGPSMLLSARMAARVSTGLVFATVLLLGLSAGAMLTEAVVLVSYWQSLPGDEFLTWFGRNEPRLVAFFGPLQTASAVLALAAFVSQYRRRKSGRGALAVAALLSLGALAMYGAYFRDVNAGFVARTIPAGDVAAELVRWGQWQWLRTAVGVAAFGAALVAATRPTAG